jgi:hypothetical protein
MRTAASNGTAAGLNISLRSKDERYPISVFIGEDSEPTFKLFFNPGDPFIMDYINKIQGLAAPDSNEDKDKFIGEYLSFTDAIEKNLDAVFGEGSARKIFRYNGADNGLILSILDKFHEGYDDYTQKARESDTKAKAEALIEARKITVPFRAPD